MLEMAIVIIVVLLVLLPLYITTVYNKLTKQKLRVKQAESAIDVYLQQRFDLIPNLVECVKKYCEYEKELLTEIAKLRSLYKENKNLETGKELNEKLASLLAIAESYPDLKADEQFLSLQKSILKMEDQLQAARRLYINDVTNYNTKIEKFPHMIFALFIGARPMKLLSFATEDVKVKF